MVLPARFCPCHHETPVSSRDLNEGAQRQTAFDVSKSLYLVSLLDFP